MIARTLKWGAGLLTFAAILLVAGHSWGQAETEQDFCTMLDSGALTVTVHVVANGAELTFHADGQGGLVREQVQALAARANARFQEGFAPPPARDEWDFAVPPATAAVLERMHGASLFLTDTSSFGSEMIREWAIRVQDILFSGECTRLLEPSGEV